MIRSARTTFILLATLCPLAQGASAGQSQQADPDIAPAPVVTPSQRVSLDDAMAFVAALEKDNEDLSALWGVRPWPQVETERTRRVRNYLRTEGAALTDDTQRASALLMLARLELVRPPIQAAAIISPGQLATYLRAAEGLSTAAEGLRRVTLAHVLIQLGERAEARELADSVLELPVGEDATRSVTARTGLEAILARARAEDDDVVRERLLAAVERADVAGVGKRLAGEARLAATQRALATGGASEVQFVEAALALSLSPRQYATLSRSALKDKNAEAILGFKSAGINDLWNLPAWLQSADPTPNEPLARRLRDLLIDESVTHSRVDRQQVARARVARALVDADLRPRLASLLKSYADVLASHSERAGGLFQTGSLLDFMAPRLAEYPPPAREQFWRLFDIALANDPNFISSGLAMRILEQRQARTDLQQYDSALWTVAAAAYTNGDRASLWQAMRSINALDRSTGEFGYTARGELGVRSALAWYTMLASAGQDGSASTDPRSAEQIQSRTELASMLDIAAGSKLPDGSDLRRDLDAARAVAWLSARRRGKAIALAQPMTDVMPSDAATPQARARAWNAWSAYLVALASVPSGADDGPPRANADDLRLRLRTLRAIDPEFGVEVAPRAAAVLKVLWTELELSRRVPAEPAAPDQPNQPNQPGQQP